MPVTVRRPIKVFLCHSSQDKPIVKELYNRLLSEGWVDPWLDKERLKLGDDFDLEIEKAIESTDAVIAFISENAVKKTGYIQKELRLVYDAQMYRPDGELFTIPLRLEECEPPHRFKYWHWGDYFGEEKEKTYQSLLNSLKLIHERVLKSEAAEKSRLEAEELERQKAAKEKAEREAREKEKYVSEKKEEKPATVKPKARNQFDYWFVGFIILGLGITFLAPLINSPSTPQLTPENTQTQVIAILPQNTVEPSVAITPKSTSTPASTLTPTPLPTEITDDFGVKMVLITAGSFTMGDDGANQAKHDITLSDYYIDIKEVTNKNYRKCVESGGCDKPIQIFSATRTEYYGNPIYDDYPVVYITWDMASNFCKQRGASLPTEAQWEKAAQGILHAKYPWGNDFNCKYANLGLSCSNGDTTETGYYELGVTTMGIYDMSGNVAEWVNDYYSDEYYKILPSNALDPQGPSNGESRVVRGGSWKSNSVGFGTVFFRGRYYPTYYTEFIGFRCARDATP